MELLVKALLVCHHHFRVEEEGDLFWKVAVMAAETLPPLGTEPIPRVPFAALNSSFAAYGEDFLDKIESLRNGILSSLPESQHQTNDLHIEISQRQQPKGIHILPPELIYCIAECLAVVSSSHDQDIENQAASATASRVCKSWYQIFSPILYRFPKFNNATQFDKFLALTLDPVIHKRDKTLLIQQMVFHRKETYCWFLDYLNQYEDETHETYPFPNLVLLHLAETYPHLERVFFVQTDGTETELEIMKHISIWVRQVEELHLNVEGIFDTFENMRNLVPANAYRGFKESALKTCLPLLDILLDESDFFIANNRKYLPDQTGSSDEVDLLRVFRRTGSSNRRGRAQTAIRQLLKEPASSSLSSNLSFPLPSPSSSSEVWDSSTNKEIVDLLLKVLRFRA